MAAVKPVQFSENGEYFAYSSPDGTLKIWETLTGTLKHEYTPSSHLSATCTCIAWGSSEAVKKTPKKKRRSSIGEAAQKLAFIALGTTSGDILLYSLTYGDLHTQLTGGHSAAVNGLCWSAQGDVLYSCSDDQHIVEWDIKASKVKHKWKGDKTAVYSVALCHTEKHLLTAGRAIKLWSLDTHTVIQKFTGHATEVLSLLPVACTKCGGGGEDAGPANNNNNNIDGSYFFSAARADRVINAWQASSITKMKTALASFSLPDEAVHVSFRSPSKKGQTFLLSAVTKSGQLMVFEHQLNGRVTVPLQPAVRVQVASSGEQTTPIPVTCSHVSAERELHIVHGNFVKPTFEKLSYKSLEPEMCLIREDNTKKSTVRLETAISKVKTPVTSGEVTVLAPGHMAPAAPAHADQAEQKQAKRKRVVSVDMTMEERLNAISIDKPKAAGATAPPQNKSVVGMLTQGLQSQDKELLSTVLRRGQLSLIQHTVTNLPLKLIVPLIGELTTRLHQHAEESRLSLKWLRVLLTTHTSYLMSFPELVDRVSSLYQLMDSRCQTFSKLARLQGKLDLMLSQITTQAEVETEDLQQPVLMYQDESSDDELGMEDVMHIHSESEDNWEELSDMEAEGAEGGGAGARIDNAKRNHEDVDDTSDSSSSDEDT